MNIDLIYIQVPKIDCKGKCSASCGPITAYDNEVDLFEKRTGKDFPDALEMLESGNLTCPHLNLLGRCDVYQNRPLICRLWGVAEGMPCVFGCTPERVLSDRIAHDMVEQTA